MSGGCIKITGTSRDPGLAFAPGPGGSGPRACGRVWGAAGRTRPREGFCKHCHPLALSIVISRPPPPKKKKPNQPSLCAAWGSCALHFHFYELLVGRPNVGRQGFVFSAGTGVPTRCLRKVHATSYLRSHRPGSFPGAGASRAGWLPATAKGGPQSHGKRPVKPEPPIGAVFEGRGGAGRAPSGASA